MEKIRKGNDINILWEIYTGSDDNLRPYSLSGKSLILYLKNTFGKEEVKDFTISGNTIRMVFWGKDQQHCGRYTLTLVENDGQKGMHTVDECDAFELVSCSCQVGGDAESKVEVTTLELKGVIKYGGTSEGGGGSIDPETIEGFIPLSRDFSDDFNNDFAR